MKSARFDKRCGSPATIAKWVLTGALAALSATSGCARSPAQPTGASEEATTANWRCRNDMEVRCGKEGCEAVAGDDFTPMDISVEGSGAMSVCAYSGCWEGIGKVVDSKSFVVLIGQGLTFSTSPDSESSKADIVIAIDRSDGVGTLKVGAFALPLLCKEDGGPAK